MNNPANESINIANLDYIEMLYGQYKSNPQSLETEWRRFFEGVDFGQGSSAGKGGYSEKEVAVYNLIQAYRSFGHKIAQLDPLGLKNQESSPDLDLKSYGLSDKDLDQKFQIGALLGLSNATLKEIVAKLKSIYSGTIAVQYMDAPLEIQKWFQKEFEKNNFTLAADEKKEALASLTRAEILEKFLHTRYVGAKRFSVEGGDSMLPMMDLLAERGSALGLKNMFIGMAHRGRVNMLINFMGKGVEYVFSDLNGSLELAEQIPDYDGDVKYHLGYVQDRKTRAGSCRLAMAYNPSHLEVVNSIVMGAARAIQKKEKDDTRKQTLPVMIHGDAAFAGQGIVFETLQMSHVPAYNIGGTLHLIVDNQVGFTTSPANARSTRYSSDVAKSIGAPIILVNGDHVESCLRGMDIALRYRQEFGRDVVVNLICYRKYGHNEGDEPAYTQPLMYDEIKKHPTPRDLYAQKLVKDQVIDAKTGEDLVAQHMDRLQQIYEDTKKSPPKMPIFKFDGYWKGLRRARPEDFEKAANTQFDIKKLTEIGNLVGSYPADFTPHPKLLKLLENRKQMGQGKEAIDWGMGELLAYGSLLAEGHNVRFTGQDVVRGTFTHRHAGIYDVKTNKPYFALAQVNPKAEFLIQDSILSEFGVMGFEYGHSITDPQTLTIWEAQFGDFVNGAQIILDQFMAAGETKWQQMSGLVLLLPHGYEGQGPEHSSARLERFLQSSAQSNWQVCNLTTPAQIYHALRRQLKREFRKPLVIMSPKSLLRHPRAISSLEELATGQFHEVLTDTVDAKSVENVIFVSGKLYYELLEEREKSQKTNTAIVRLEQIYPFPSRQVADVLKSYPKLKNLIWAQEEPRNMGAFQSVYFKFMDTLRSENLKLNLTYVGRPEKASPATGSLYRHKAEQAEIVANCFKF